MPNKKEQFTIDENGCFLELNALKRYCEYFEQTLNKEIDGATWKQHFDKEVQDFRTKIIACGGG